jgi:hypothetical protein
MPAIGCLVFSIHASRPAQLKVRTGTRTEAMKARGKLVAGNSRRGTTTPLQSEETRERQSATDQARNSPRASYAFPALGTIMRGACRIFWCNPRMKKSRMPARALGQIISRNAGHGCSTSLLIKPLQSIGPCAARPRRCGRGLLQSHFVRQPPDPKQRLLHRSTGGPSELAGDAGGANPGGDHPVETKLLVVFEDGTLPS